MINKRSCLSYSDPTHDFDETLPGEGGGCDGRRFPPAQAEAAAEGVAVQHLPRPIPLWAGQAPTVLTIQAYIRAVSRHASYRPDRPPWPASISVLSSTFAAPAARSRATHFAGSW